MTRAVERKIALCVSSWSADSTLYAWTFVKNYFLRVRSRGFADSCLLSRAESVCACTESASVQGVEKLRGRIATT